MKPAVFILTYKDINYLNSWIDVSAYKNIDLYILDNGPQVIPERLQPFVIHKVYQNIFCSGGWNLICKIAFKKMAYDKIIITQDDLKFTEQQVISTLNYTNKSTIIGGRNDMFFYSFFGIHKETYNKVGEFDESFLEVTCEDNDYHYRSILAGIQHRSMEYTMSNENLSSSQLSWKFGNKEYLIEKWGPEKSWGEFTYTIPFNGKKQNYKINRDRYFSHINFSKYGIDVEKNIEWIHNLNGSDMEYIRSL